MDGGERKQMPNIQSFYSCTGAKEQKHTENSSSETSKDFFLADDEVKH